MKKVIETFMHNGMPFFAGMEVADDPELSWAEKRGLLADMDPKPEPEKKPAKKPAAKKK